MRPEEARRRLGDLLLGVGHTRDQCTGGNRATDEPCRQKLATLLIDA